LDPASTAYSKATGINPAGQVVGLTSASGTMAVRWEKGNTTTLGTLGGCCSVANAINAAGDIVGQSVISTGQARAFLWSKGV
jgi:probable HAF family extracellular repeat protein